jgi:hypothetical protein
MNCAPLYKAGITLALLGVFSSLSFGIYNMTTASEQVEPRYQCSNTNPILMANIKNISFALTHFFSIDTQLCLFTDDDLSGNPAARRFPLRVLIGSLFSKSCGIWEPKGFEGSPSAAQIAQLAAYTQAVPVATLTLLNKRFSEANRIVVSTLSRYGAATVIFLGVAFLFHRLLKQSLAESQRQAHAANMMLIHVDFSAG